MYIEQFLAQIRERAWNTATLGRQFELLVKAFLKTEPLYANLYTDVWMWDECPYVSGRDTGMDLVARDIHGDFTGIQCKCYRPGTRVEKPDVDTFLSVLGSSVSVDGEKLPFRHGLYVVTNEDISDNARAALDGFRVPVNLMTLSVLRNSTIDWAHFNFGKTAKRVERHHEREHQKRAIKDVLDGFRSEERGQLIMACGTGKTFTALKIAERMLAENEKPSVLFLVPSIALLGQTLREWTAQAERPICPVAVCSDPKASRKLSDDEQEAQGDGTASLGFPATTDSEKIRRFVKLISSRGKDGMLVVFSTYQSLDAVSEAQKSGALKTFDLIVCDEAHRTTAAVKKDNAESNFYRVHEQGFIKGRKRLYMTATPRVYSADAMRKADDEAILCCSMDDKTKFGPVFHTLNFSRAVSKGLLSDYKVLILAVSESEVRSLGFRDLNGDGELDNIDMVAKMVGSWKGLNKDVYKEDRAFLGDDTSPMRSAVVFAANIRESKLFTDSFQHLVEEHYSEDAKLRPAQLRHVDGTMNALKRARDIEWLRGAEEDTECRVLSNAKCLSEGVDVPSLDAIIFLSPRKSTVEVVQAVGRVMRKDPKGKKKLGYVILPMMVPDGEDVSTVLDMNERYKVVWAVLTALRSHDNSFNALENKVEIIRVSVGTGSGGSSGPQPDPPPILIDRELFEKYKNAIHTKLARVCGEKKYWSVWAEDIARVVHAQITRFTHILSKKGNPYQKDFDKFLSDLRETLNEGISTDDAIRMLAQQLVSVPIFNALFEDYAFVRDNPVSQVFAKMLDTLNADIDERDRKILDGFYQDIKQRAATTTTSAQKQAIVLELYNNFFRIAFKDTVDELGIVYTPVEVVDFIIHSVESVLKTHFNSSLSKPNVNVLDPFTGTGTFIVRLLQSKLIKPNDLLQKFQHEIHANEIVLLAYYIAAINIESVFHDLYGKDEYHHFEGMLFTDTFLLTNELIREKNAFVDNSKRAKRQRKLPIKVIIGNPPYNVAKSAARHYELEKRIAETYAAKTDATNKNSLYDSYIKSFRWASDRIGDSGVVAFVTNGGWLDGNAMNGFRTCLAEEFSHVYVFNLRGNQRTSGELSRREGGKIFGSGSRAPIAITVLVKLPTHKEGDAGEIHYHDIGDYLTREQKLKIISDFHDISGIPWVSLNPDAHGDWINQRNGEFDAFIPLAPETKFDDGSYSYFTLNSSGLKTGMDAIATGFSREKVVQSVKGMNESANVKMVCATHYRPFCVQNLYYDKSVNQRQYRIPNVFPTHKHKNLVICVSGVGVTKDFTCIVTEVVPDLELIGKSQCFPLYWYEKIERKAQQTFDFMSGDDEYVRHDGISDFILKQFRQAIGPKANKEDIFYFVYAALHHPGYRTKFAADLKKQLPRLPVPVSMDDYRLMVMVGRDLAALHLHYEDIVGYGLKEVWTGADARDARPYQVTKMSWGKKGKDEDRSKIVVNGMLTLEGIPAKAHEYVVNGRSALEWIIDRYQIRTDKDSGITNDPNDWGREHGNPRYIVDLIQSVTTVSVKTVDLVKKLEGVRLREQNSGQDLQAGVRAANPVRNSEVLREIGEALKFREYLPVYSFKAACGPLAGGQEVEVEGWIKVEGHGKLDPTQFVVRTEGVSMEGLIPEGAMCIMRKLGGGGLEGKTILVQRNDVSDPEGGGAYTIKTFTRKGKKVVLKAKDSTYDILLKDDAEYSQKYRAIAEFKGVL